MFLAFLSPSYFASEVCRREWKAWIDQEIAKHILTEGAAPIYIVEVPGFISKPPLSEHEVAAEDFLQVVPSHFRRTFRCLSVVAGEGDASRRQLDLVQPFYNAGVTALQQADVEPDACGSTSASIWTNSEHVRRAAESENTVPPYNEKFTGRQDELIELRRRLKDDRTGVICGIHGLGGIGKTELAYTYRSFAATNEWVRTSSRETPACLQRNCAYRLVHSSTFVKTPAREVTRRFPMSAA